ncbi:MAG: regulatory protein GemA [Pseudomonadales bacterium]|nr:regulatory protein GemA [Pseudomonadales bacterium]
MKQTKSDPRRAELARIHMGATALGMDTSDPDPGSAYRSMLFTLARVSSARDLDAGGRRAVLEHLRAMGWSGGKRRGSYPGRPHNINSEPMLQKIEAILAELKAPWSYADGIARRQCGIARAAWLRTTEDLRAVLMALLAEQQKRQLLAALDENLLHLGKTREQLEAEMPGLRKGWARRVPDLRAALEHVGNQLQESIDA